MGFTFLRYALLCSFKSDVFYNDHYVTIGGHPHRPQVEPTPYPVFFYLQYRLCLLGLSVGKGSFQKFHGPVCKNLGSSGLIQIGEEVCES